MPLKTAHHYQAKKSAFPATTPPHLRPSTPKTTASTYQTSCGKKLTGYSGKCSNIVEGLHIPLNNSMFLAEFSSVLTCFIKPNQGSLNLVYFGTYNRMNLGERELLSGY